MVYLEEQERYKVRKDVQDNGNGIPADVPDRVFIPFFTTKKQGSGIGVSPSKQIIRQHGGSIRVSSTMGGPVTFAFFCKQACQHLLC